MLHGGTGQTKMPLNESCSTKGFFSALESKHITILFSLEQTCILIASVMGTVNESISNRF